MFGETVLGFLKQTHKGAPQWTKGVWLGKTLSNDVHIIGIPGAQQLFVTRNARRLPASKAWNGEMIGGVEACPWQFSYASLGSQLVLAKRIAPPTPSPSTPAPVRDFDAELVMNLPPTPDERPHVPRLVAPTQSAVLVGDTADDENMDVSIEAGVPSALGAAVPQTPHDVQQSDAASGLSPGDVPSGAATSAVVHPRDGGEDSERPAKHQRILAFFEHEDRPNETQSTVRTLMSLNLMTLTWTKLMTLLILVQNFWSSCVFLSLLWNLLFLTMSCCGWTSLQTSWKSNVLGTWEF